MKMHILTSWRKKFCVAAVSFLGIVPAMAKVDIADAPIFETNIDVPPNVMILMDTSESMSWTHMPDRMQRLGEKQYRSYTSSACNSIYYDPDPKVKYHLPKDAEGKELPKPSFNAAFYDYYGDGGARKVDLATEFQAHDENTVDNDLVGPDEKQPAYYHVRRNGFDPTDLSSDLKRVQRVPAYKYYCENREYKARKEEDGKQHRHNTYQDTDEYWKKVIVGPDEQEKFAIWYSYYRTRLAMAKSALSLALDPFEGEKYRIGFITVNPLINKDGSNYDTVTGKITGVAKVQPDRYEPIRTFDAEQRGKLYEKIFSQTYLGRSPAREGLARVGRHYAGKKDGINLGMDEEDPVIDVCQRNYTILTTDGYWNALDETAGPVGIDGSTHVGNQDGHLHKTYKNEKPGVDIVPWGVFDGGKGALSRRQVDHVFVKYGIENCSKTINLYQKYSYGYWKKPIIYVKHQERMPPSESIVSQRKKKKEITPSGYYTERTWDASADYLQIKKVTKKTWKHEFIYQQGQGEAKRTVAFCNVAEANCVIVNLNSTGEYVNPNDCEAQKGDTTNKYRHITCRTEEKEDYVTECSHISAADMEVECSKKEEKKDVPVSMSDCHPNRHRWGGGSYIDVFGDKWYKTCKISNDTTTKVDKCSTDTLPLGKGRDSCTYHDTSTSTTTIIEEWHVVDSCTAGTDANGVVTECTTKRKCVPSAANNNDCSTTVTRNVSRGGECVGEAASKENDWTRSWCEEVVGGEAEAIANSGTDPDCKKGYHPTKANGWQGYYCSWTGHKYVGESTDDNYCTAEEPSQNNGLIGTYCWKTTTEQSGRKLVERRRRDIYYEYPDLQQIYDRTEINYGYFPITDCKFGADAAALRLPDPSETDYIARHDPEATGSYTGSINSLADVAQYYYATNLRDWLNDEKKWPDDAMTARAIWPGADDATWQHMVTYVIGLGVSGTLEYDPNYINKYGNAKGIFAEIRGGREYWPIWPKPNVNYEIQENYHVGESIDDFWHAAVNGRGKYFSAYDPKKLAEDIRKVLDDIDSDLAVGTGVTLKAASTADGLFSTSYITNKWTGDLNFGGTDGGWSAGELLQKRIEEKNVKSLEDDRRIYIRQGGTLVNFEEGKIPGKVLSEWKAGFNKLSQWEKMEDAEKKKMTTKTLISYLRGNKKHEEDGLYRARESALGDFVNSKPVYVKGGVANYTGGSYRAFKAAKAGRQGMVYVGANDGMLHAFYAEDAGSTKNAGQEAWAYIPTQVMGKMVKLADIEYGKDHQYFVDGTPFISDVEDGGEWKTILIAGLGAGGNGYYALDITDPDAPKSLWETQESCASCDIGMGFGKPLVSKMKDGTWVVFLTSGYNNKSGKGIVFVLNAMTGELIKEYNTQVGSPSDQAGLAHVAGYAKFQRIDNTAERLYAGDLLGNIWRFNLDDNIEDAEPIELLGIAKEKGGKPQAITSAPSLPVLKDKAYVVFGTGRMLAHSDGGREQWNTIYSIVDPLESGKGASGLHKMVYTNLREDLTECALDKNSKVTCAGGDDKHPNGWLVDLANEKEHISASITLTPEYVLVAQTNEPEPKSCAYSAFGRMHFIRLESVKNAAKSIDIKEERDGKNPEYFPPNDAPVVMGAIREDKPISLPKELLPPECKGGDGTCVYVKTSKGTIRGQTISDDPVVQGDRRVSWRELTAPAK